MCRHAIERFIDDPPSFGFPSLSCLSRTLGEIGIIEWSDCIAGNLRQRIGLQ
jgi:hypothetical protein